MYTVVVHHGNKVVGNIMRINGMIIKKVIMKIKEMHIIKQNFNKIKMHINKNYGIVELD
jgi:hypothetical protein